MQFFSRVFLCAVACLACAPAVLAQELQGLGFLPGGNPYTEVNAISADGTTAVGLGISANGYEAFRWTSIGGIQGLGSLGGSNFFSIATAVNGDGSVVVGSSESQNGPEAFRWTEAGGMIGLSGSEGLSFEWASGVSADGEVVVGSGDSINGNEAIRWTQAGGAVGLGDLSGGSFHSSADAVSADGKVVVGWSDSSNGQEAFRWTAGGGMKGLGDLAGGDFESYANAVSADGNVVVGAGTRAAGFEAYRWTEAGGMVGLGYLPGGHPYSSARAVSADGSVVVGKAASAVAREAFRWTEATGMQTVRELLIVSGVDTAGWVLQGAEGVSADGNTIVGFNDGDGQTGDSWIARLSPSGAGLTTPGAQQQSVSTLANDRSGVMAQQHGLANPLLGGDKPLTGNSEVGAFGMGGSSAGGGYARYATGDGIAILAGVSYGEEAYQHTAVEDSLMGALALRYLTPGKSLWRPFVEVGGWFAPDSRLDFDRAYVNGAGTSIGSGSTQGDVSYYYGRAGVVFDFGKREQLVVSGELGHERLETGGYAEDVPGNPFSAIVPASTDEMELVKARLAWSIPLSSRLDATLWCAGVHAFNRETDLLAAVSGVGLFAPVIDDGTAWVEYGARVGYAVTETVTLDVFTNGVSGDNNIGTRLHGGAGLRYRF